MTKKQQEQYWKETLNENSDHNWIDMEQMIRSIFRFDLLRQYKDRTGMTPLNNYIWDENSNIDTKELLNCIRQYKLDVILVYNNFTGGMMNVPHESFNKGIVQNTRWLLDSEYGKEIYEYLLTRQHEQFGLYVTQEMLKYFRKKWN